jgi:hypothetical protein
MRRLALLTACTLAIACGSSGEGPSTNEGPGATGGTSGSGGTNTQDAGGQYGDASVDGDASFPPDAPVDTPPPSCDPGFDFSPEPLETGKVIYASFTHDDPLTDVGIAATGPGTVHQGNLSISGANPWTWTWPMTVDAGGTWVFTFTAGDPQITYGTCAKGVADTGAPPTLPTGSCEGKVCGESDGQGGTCEQCPMEGTCLDPPSPYGPGGPGSWSCLDVAGCQDWGQCRIWCPGEPCDSVVHPDGCPQGVETCFVDPHITSYEEACKACCESRHHAPTGEYACWDDAFSLCRYPGDCGKPLLNPP